MTPSTLVRAQRGGPFRGPFTFAAFTAMLLERPKPNVQRPTYKRCVALQDDGSPCALPARYVDMQRGGHVCFEHRPDRRQDAFALV